MTTDLNLQFSLRDHVDRLFPTKETAHGPAFNNSDVNRIDLSGLLEPYFEDFFLNLNLAPLAHPILFQALCHSSYCYERKDLRLLSNERLEFLGDAVLGLYVTKRLIQVMPKQHEGHLSKIKAYLVGKEFLSPLAVEMGLERFLLLGKGEGLFERTQNRLLANFLEAILGALEQIIGTSHVFHCLDFFMAPRMDEEIKRFSEEDFFAQVDPKTALQEKSLKAFQELPQYTVVEEGDHEFEVELHLKNQLLAKAKSFSKKAAYKEAARRALDSDALNELLTNP